MLSVNNKKKYDLTLKAITEKSNIKNPYIVKENYYTTLITDEKTIYMYFNSEEITFNDLKTALKKFIATNKYDVDVDIDSFTKNDNSKETIKNFVDMILYENNDRFTYKTTKPAKKYNFNLLTNDPNAKKILDFFEVVYKYKNLARKLQDMAPNDLTAEVFAKIIKIEADKIDKLKVTILTQTEIKKLKMGLLLAVNAGSAKDARVVILEYKGNPKSKEKTAFVGKGITFDTGGISLKPSIAMEGMKYDMSGAAIACASVLTIAALKGKQNVCAIGCLTENQIGSSATLVESVITSMNGKSVEITNTDAEGRLVVADGITYAIRNLKASRIIELSTLTGAMLICLGHYMTGVFADDEKFYEEFAQAAKIADEEIWRMPIHRTNVANMKKTNIADIRNTAPTRLGGSSNAAAFIQQFTENKPFIHLDIAGTATETRLQTSGTGVMVKTLVKMLL